MRVELLNGSQIQFQNKYPQHYQPYILAGSLASFSGNDWGNILLQEFLSDKFSIRYTIIDIFKKANLLFFNNDLMMQVSLNLQETLRLKPNNGKNIVLTKDQHGYFENNGSTKLTLEKGKHYRIFETLYHEKTIDEIKADLQDENLLARLLENSKNRANIIPGELTPSKIKLIVDEIIESTAPAELKNFFFRLKVEEILFEILLENASHPAYNAPLSPDYIASLSKAREIVLADIKKHKLIPDIARQVHMNEFDLKTGFKKLYNVGIYELLLASRMERAKQLLIETDIPIKEVAAMVGYPRITSFIRAFRNFYDNTTPGSLRRSSTK